MIRLKFPYFLERIDTIDVLMIDEEGRTLGSHPLSYDAELQEFYLLFDIDHSLYYQLRINDKFMINNVNCPHVLVQYKMVTLLTSDSVSYETGMTCTQSGTFGYLTETKRKYKKSFAFLHEKVHCSFTFDHATNVLYLLEVIDPHGQLFDLHEYVILPGANLEHAIVIPRDHEVYGKWRINVYSSGQYVAGQHFRLIPATRYSFHYEKITKQLDMLC